MGYIQIHNFGENTFHLGEGNITSIKTILQNNKKKC
jgi:hypothetical protein